MILFNLETARVIMKNLENCNKSAEELQFSPSTILCPIIWLKIGIPKQLLVEVSHVNF
jgi:hypothetical protein